MSELKGATVRKGLPFSALPPEIQRAIRERERAEGRNTAETEVLSSEQGEEVRVRKGLSKSDIPEEARRKIKKLNS